MDLMTIFGVLFGAGAVYFVMWDSNIARFLYDRNSLILVLGGTIASTIISFPWSSMKQVPGALRFIFFPPKHFDTEEMMDVILDLSQKVKQSGIDILQADVDNLKDKFLSKGIQLILDGQDINTVEDILRKEMILMQQRHQRVTSVFRAMGTFAPVFGLLGTLIGVLQVLGILNDPKQSIQEGMSVAITTTFYGIFGANFIFLPAAIKLSEHSDKEILNMEIALEGLHGIVSGEVPSVIRKRLSMFISKRLRDSEKVETK